MNDPLKNHENEWHKDEFASGFHGMGTVALAHQLFFHSAQHYLGDIKGKTLLDVGSGEGEFCTLIKSKGASQVIGVDISSFLLEQARQQDPTIEYRYGNAYELGIIGQFDFVTANRLIPYSETKDDLVAMCRGFYDNLKDGGRFVGTTINCFQEPNYGTKLAHLNLLNFVRLAPTTEAERYEIEYFGNAPAATKFTAYVFPPNVYEEAFKEVGFTKITFQPALIDKSIEQPQGFWTVMEEKPLMICIVADK